MKNYYNNIKKLRLLHPCYDLGVTSKERLWTESQLFTPNSYLLLMLLYIYIPIVIYKKGEREAETTSRIQN